jgi:hypothetical protein
LFELEVLLKGVACFANPRNHPGPPRRVPLATADFTWHLACVRDGASNIVVLARQLQANGASAVLARRYLATALPGTRSGETGVAPRDGTPDESLAALRHALTHALAVADGALRLQRVPFRLFYALSSLVRSEIAHNVHFNPLSALEFRPEFDSIQSRAVLDLIARVPGRATRRLVALTFVSLLRMGRYVGLVAATGAAASVDPRQQAGRIYLILAVLRSDARALSTHLDKRATALLNEGFEDDIFSRSAVHMVDRHDELAARGRALSAVKEALDSVAANISVEIRRIFEKELPAPDAGLRDDELLERLRNATREVAPLLAKTMAFLANALGGSEHEFEQYEPAREASERRRRDAWTFAQIIRAFVSKAEHARPAQDRWTAVNGYAFAREFLAYFRALGYPLARLCAYPRTRELASALRALKDVDLIDGLRLERAVAEAQSFQAFLSGVQSAISGRDELDGVPFDRRAAARTLRRYLKD